MLIPIKPGINIIPAQLLERLPLRLRDTQRREDTQEHEQRINLHDVSLVGVGWCSGLASCAFGAQFRDPGLSDDGTDFAHAGGETMGGGPVAGGEALAGDDEGCCVRA
jgi:hypothetical protein